MNIGFLTTYFHPFRGGAEENAFSLAKHLANNNEVHVFTSDRKNGVIVKKSVEFVDGVTIHRCHTVLRYRYYMAFYPSLLKELLKYDFDIVHIHSFGFLWHDFCIWFYKKKHPNVKIVVTPHGPVMALRSYGFVQRIAKRVILFFEKLFIKKVDAVIEVNPSQEEWLIKDFGIKKEKIFYIPNGISVDTLRINDFKKTLKDYRLDDKFIISYVGRLHKYKGLDQVIKVLPDILKIRKNIVFVLFGDEGDYIAELKSMTKELKLEENVKFLLNKDDKTKFDILQASEIYVFPSEWEAFGISVLEAMAKKNAIVSTKTEGGKFLIGKENGFLYNFGDTTKLRDLLIILLKDSKLRKKMQAANFRKAKLFTWNSITNDLNKLYKRLLQ